jgi:exopolysaccharide biosynthesis polyprenyl glycosylphosphotransferase
VNDERTQCFGFRFADMACSIGAFLVAYASLPWIETGLQQLFPRVLAEMRALSVAPAAGPHPNRASLLWIFAVITITRGLLIEYSEDSRPLRDQTVRRIFFLQLFGTAAALGVVATIFFALRVPPSSRLFVFSYAVLLFASTVTYRLITRNLVRGRRQGSKIFRRAVVTGRPKAVEKFILSTNIYDRLQTEIVGCLVLDDEAAPSPALPVPVLGNISMLGELLIHDPIDEVIIVLPRAETPWLAQAIKHCDYFRVGVQVVHESMMDLDLRDLMPRNGRYTVPSISLIPEEEFASDTLAWKRLMDIVVSATALMLLSPLFVAIGIAIKVTTPELPILYRWNVVGYRGRRFVGYKFTTMVAGDELKASLASLNEMTGPVFKIRNDPRITRLGKFLRKYSLNELPQLWSVLVGDMSLVGPRPAGPHELVRYQMWHKRKLSVWPGITCFWQVRGRNAVTNFDDWVKMDLEYIQKRSVRTDMAILAQTISVVFRGTGS